ncbi:MAG: hypothetical protein P1V51_14690 [Deltaproteobacteria bacterium]|nr:hypothetical protein [Deltaproteobacteria bacterium]
MRNRIALFSALALLTGLVTPLAARAQVTVSVNIPLPTIHFDVTPATVVVAPGIRVVPEYEHEVFFVGGHYWHLHDGHWYRAKSLKHPKWKKWKHKDVPPGLRKLPPGKYKHWKHQRKAEQKAEKRHHKVEKHEGKAFEKGHDKGFEKGHGKPGKGKGKGR